MQGHAQTCVEVYCVSANKMIEQQLLVWMIIKSKKEVETIADPMHELKSLSNVCTSRRQT